MKEKIEKKLEENIERILNKKELTPTDVAILEEKLRKVKEEEEKPLYEERMKKMFENGFLNN